MKLGIIQNAPHNGDFIGNLRSIVQGYRDCVDRGADIVIASAQALEGINSKSFHAFMSYHWQVKESLRKLSLELMESPLILAASGCPYLIEKEKVTALQWNTCFLAQGKLLACTQDTEDTADQTPELSICLRPSPCGLREIELELEFLPCTPHALAMVQSVAVSDGTIFAGGSYVTLGNDILAARLPLYTVTHSVINLNIPPKKSAIHIKTDRVANIYDGLVFAIRESVQKTGAHSLCLGLSGGVDSALVAALAVAALGAENVYGLALPSPFSSQGSLDDAYALATNLGISCKTVPITGIFNEVNNSLRELFHDTTPDTTEENMQSRIRGLILMAYANKFGHILVGTGNKSEALVGYCTMYGDTCGAFLPLGDLYKTEVYELCAWINRNEEIIPWNTINKPPSAELRPDQIDQDNLPPYEELDGILCSLVDEQEDIADIVEEFDEETVRKIQRLTKASAWKRRQLPPTLHIISGDAPLAPEPSTHAYQHP